MLKGSYNQVAKLILKKQNGLALLELMVALALIGIVLFLGYMFFDFGARTFARGERQSIAQSSIRLGADFITNEIRYADKLVYDPNDPMKEEHYYIKQEGSSVIYYYVDENGNKTQERTMLDSVADGMIYEISFDEANYIEISQNQIKVVILFTLKADTDLYVLDTKVNILNLNNQDNYENEGSIPAPAIMFKKPAIN